MGTLSVTLDRLSHFTSTLTTSKRQPNVGIDLTTFEINLDDKAKRAFAEFNTGMEMLHKHGMHNDCNIQDISRHNLKLLHGNLKYSKNYRSSVRYLSTHTIASPQWSWIPLIETTNMRAGFLYLAAGKSVTFNNPGIAITLRHNNLIAPFAQPDHSQLYLNLLGKIQIQCLSPENQLTTTQILKKGYAIAENNAGSVVHRLSAGQDTSLLLNVQLNYTGVTN